jgi:AcrR family transcriptional regulator
MGIAERKSMEKEALKKKILEAASEIIIKEGYEHLSIRKIANMIEYSPGTIYQYFQDKSEIVSCIVEEGYRKILQGISNISFDPENPEESMHRAIRSYISVVLENSKMYRAILMHDIEGANEKVWILHEGVSQTRESMALLCRSIELGIRQRKFKPLDVEPTAQIIWTSTHGLVYRLLIEKNISDQQKEKLIDHHLKLLSHGLLVGPID